MVGQVISWLALLVMGTQLGTTTGLICYCTESRCLSKERSNMCTGDANLGGCYKEYNPNNNPPILMGCVGALLFCNVVRPSNFPVEEWPVSKCCDTDQCNKFLNVTPSDYTRSHMSEEQTTPESLPSEKSMTNSNDRSRSDDIDAENLHPVFVSLIVLALIFLVVIIASVTVIIRIWLYRKQKPKQRDPWSCRHLKIQQNHLLPSVTLEDGLKSDTSSSTLTSNFDVP